jgi:DNA-binding MarR family transcriptional regulator
VLNNEIEQFRAKLREIDRTVWIQTKSEALCCGVTMAQCHAIMEIGEAGELNLKELAARLGLDNSTLSRTVESLVQDGLADRTPSKEDRRATIIRSTIKAVRPAIDQCHWNQICRDSSKAFRERSMRNLLNPYRLLRSFLPVVVRGNAPQRRPQSKTELVSEVCLIRSSNNY